MKCENELPRVFGSNQARCKHCRRFYRNDLDAPECPMMTLEEARDAVSSGVVQCSDDQRFLDQAAIAIMAGLAVYKEAFEQPFTEIAEESYGLAESLLKERKRRMGK